MPMFYNPAEYSNKGVVNQPSFIDPYQQQQGGAEQQQQQQNQQQSDVNQQQFQGDNHHQDQFQQQDWNYQQQPQDPNYSYSDGSMPHDQSSGQNFTPYDQQPYYTQQSNDSMQGNADYGPAQNQWNQGPVGPEMERGWNDPNFQGQEENNVPNLESKQGNKQIEVDEDSGCGGYLGMFHNDDNESDFLESDQTESSVQTNQQALPAMPPPRTSNGNEGFVPQGLNPTAVSPEGADSILQPYQPGQLTLNQAEVPQAVYSPISPVGVNNPSGEGHPAEGYPAEGYPGQGYTGEGYPGEQLQEEKIDNVQSNNSENDNNVQPIVQQQQLIQEASSLNDHSLQNQFASPAMNSPLDSLETNQITEAESLCVNDGGSDIGPPSSCSSIAGSLPPSEPSASSSTTSRSNSMLEDVSSTGVSSSDSRPPEMKKELGEQSEICAPSDMNVPHFGEGHQEQVSVPPVVTSPMQSPDSLPTLGQSLPPPPPSTDISRQNSAVSDLSNMSVPSTTDTNISTTGSSLAESEQQLNQDEPLQNNVNNPSVGGGSAPPPLAQNVPPKQDTVVIRQDIPQMPTTSQSNIQAVPVLPQPNQPSGLQSGELPPPAHNPTNPQPVGQTPPNPAALAPPVHSQPQSTQSTNPLSQTNPCYPELRS
ncbi:uncharacterized protein [Amphiura filiformis]|uniref:uncharacterized protein isoform X2 n=1 Tax=Amphiura filiformis TaxID=82378 RepID=UPI003B21C12E